MPQDLTELIKTGLAMTEKNIRTAEAAMSALPPEIQAKGAALFRQCVSLLEDSCIVLRAALAEKDEATRIILSNVALELQKKSTALIEGGELEFAKADDVDASTGRPRSVH